MTRLCRPERRSWSGTPHSRQVPGASFAGRDATVFWNYVDLRFRTDGGGACRITVELSADELRGAFSCSVRDQIRVPLVSPSSLPAADARATESCETCGMDRLLPARPPQRPCRDTRARCGWLMRFLPEIDGWMMADRMAADMLLLPLASRRLRLGPYRWVNGGFRLVPAGAMGGALNAPRFLVGWPGQEPPGSGPCWPWMRKWPARRRGICRSWRLISIICQNLLPFLWRDGVLGGRTFDVLMTRYPLHGMQAILDRCGRDAPGEHHLGRFSRTGGT